MVVLPHAAASLVFLSCESQCFRTSSSRLHIFKCAYSCDFLLDVSRTTFLELNSAHAEDLWDLGLLRWPSPSTTPTAVSCPQRRCHKRCERKQKRATWLSNSVPDCAIQLNQVICYRVDRVLIAEEGIFSHTVVAVYIPPCSNNNNRNEALNELYQHISEQQKAHSDAFIILAGDFNHADLKSVFPKIPQHNNFPTRGKNTLDFVFGAYKAVPQLHLGASDHCNANACIQNSH
ncbi:uncharacterized protein LOC132143242 [Carassius carassius]|uniref:uncharacterized protein LOC132143242 n=1 Tax=Carassius carassius TaxID=217509 RepID=UPI0028695BB1|nr:uncharacterized protein LOC132143242 [Carassius carassius]